MTTIRLNAVGSTKAGVKFDAFVNGFFSDFAFQGWPYLLGGSGGNDGTELVMLDNVAGAATKTIVMDGQGFVYDSNAHVMSGTLQSIELGTLGPSYQSNGSFAQDASGRISGVAASVEITGLSVTNGPSGGEFHDITASFMRSAGGVRQANADLLKQLLTGEAATVIGSTGNDTYTGTAFSDTIRGRGGNDVLTGAVGRDRIFGDAGNDRLIGGIGADRLNGGAGSDTFVFKTVKESTRATGGRDTILDFSQEQYDRVNLSAIDAHSGRKGNQAFTFIGDDVFHGQAGELRAQSNASSTVVLGDVNGDGTADFAITFARAITFTAGDFIL